MSSKLIFLLLIALLLVQCLAAKPMPDDYIAAEVPKEEETMKECKAGDSKAAVDSFFLGELNEFTDMMLTNEKKFSKDLVAIVNAMTEISGDLTIKMNTLNELVKKLDKIDLREKNILGRKLALVVEMDHLLSIFRTTETGKPNDEDLVIADSLNKYEMEGEVEFFQFAERLYVAADQFWDSLCLEEQAEHEEFAEWLKLFKNETNLEKKIRLLLGVTKGFNGNPNK